MDRRNFLTSFPGFLALARWGLFVSISAKSQVANASPFSVVIAVLQVVSTISKLMQKSGPGSVDLLNLQTEMLKSIQTELSVIETNLGLVLADLDELKKLIQQTPNEVVIQLYRDQILARQGDYLEIMSTYQAILSTKGIKNARKKVIPELKTKVLSQLRTSRSDLMTHYEFGIIPIVCTAAYIEFLVAVMIDEPKNYKERTIKAIDRYEEWLKKVTSGPGEHSLKKAIYDTSLEQKNFRKQAEALNLQYKCTEKFFSDDPAHCTGLSLFLTCSTVLVESKLHRVRDNPAVAASIREMLKDHSLNITDAPVTVDINFSFLEPDQNFNGCQENVIQNAKAICSDEALNVTCSTKKNEILKNAEELSKDLTTGGLSLMTLKALQSASDIGLAFLADMRKKIEEQKND
ncbi:MAG TPA: hypothetical protein PKL53_08215 [Methylotenera sp.]|nr:hypothetical protein [Methylotenera sp.]HPV45832.1 hypothetical protein [Methylotenera sp.]